MMDKNYYFSIDVGGTDIKGGVVSCDGTILACTKIPTNARALKFDLSQSIVNLVNKLEVVSGCKVSNALGIGIGLPGLIDSNRGILRHSGNLGLSNYPIISKLENHFDIPIKIANDADVATIAELYFGAGKEFDNFVMIMVGTGIGGGVVINKKPLSELADYSAEFGHMKVTDKKILCTCGRTGCFEAVASTRALTNLITSELSKNQKSKILNDFHISEVSAKTLFDYIGRDKTTDKVFDEFIINLGDGIVNLVNIFSPDAVIIGGAISAQKQALLKPLEKYVNNNIYASNAGKKVKFVVAKETGNVGIIGAMCLFLN